MKKIGLAALFLCGLMLLSACAPMARDPLAAAMTTPVPGTQSDVQSPVAREGTGDSFLAVLYFRFMQEELLAQESRKLTVPMDDSLEKALVAAVLQGPSASSPELRRLFSGQVEVVSTLSQDATLFVTLSESALYEPMENRFLQMQSLAATLIENCGYESVQILIDQKSAPATSLKLSSAFFEPNADGAAPPLTRQDAYILSPFKTAQVILDAWIGKDYERLYQFIAAQDTRLQNARPPYQTALSEIDGGFSLTGYNLGPASVSPDGGRAVMNAEMSLLRSAAEQRSLTHYPIILLRENGIWKIRYQDFLSMVYR